MAQAISQLLKLGREKLAQAAQRAEQHLFWYQDNSVEIKGTPNNKVYAPSPTGLAAHNDDSFVRLIMGPYGSGKTTWAINEIIRRTCEMPAWHNGRRNARWVIIRNTSGELHSTTLRTWLAWCDELGVETHRSKPLLQYEHVFRDDYGIVELELIFLALDRPDDIHKLKSLEVTGGYLNELSELPEAVLSHLKGRLNGRYPSRSFCPTPYWSGIIADTNPPDEDSWIYQSFVKAPVEDYKIFRQPPGLIKVGGQWEANPNAENIKFLSPDYYTKLASGQKEEFIKVFCNGDWGIVEIGKRVFPEFNTDIHAVDHLEAIQGHPIELGFDFGLTPSCGVFQVTPRGQALLLKEYVGVDIGIRSFAESVVLPGLRRDFPYCSIGSSTGDPAGAAKDTIFEEMSCISELTSLGIETHTARTNALEPRLNAWRFFLNRMIDGKPALLISKSGCPMAYKGLSRDYIYKRVAVIGEERYKETPDKGATSHIIDGFGYGLLEYAADQIAATKTTKPDPMACYNPVIRIL